jgi:hypothetical protein
MNISESFTLKDKEYNYYCTIPWRDGDNNQHWDKICISAIELFGMPGKRYITYINQYQMSWIFKTPQDQLLFKLKFSESVC